MIDFKYQKDRRDWNGQPIKCDKSANHKLRILVEWVDLFCQLLGWGSLIITSYYRPSDKDSYHSILQAVDIRTHNQPDNFKIYMQVLGSILRTLNPELQIFVHRELWGTPNEHIHVAIKNGAIKK